MRLSSESGDKPLREGSYDMAPVLPVLTLNELASLDSDGILANAGLTRRIKGPRRALAQALARRKAAIHSSRPADAGKTEDAQAEKGALPERSGTFRGLSSYAPPIPWHMATISESRLLTPFGVSGWPALDGPIIGRSVMNGNVWRYDAWSPYRYDKTSVNGLILGMMGSGKSTVLKVMCSRETLPPWNRHVLVEGDPKGEWAPVARAVGGDVIEVGGGQYLNPLDPGSRPMNFSEEKWRAEILGNQVDTMKSIAHVLRPAQEFSTKEKTLTHAVLRELAETSHVATIAAFYDLLRSDWIEHVEIAGMGRSDVLETANDLVLLFGDMVDGSQSGAFEHESTVNVDPASPMLVFNTGSVMSKNETKKALYTACMSSAVENLCNRHDGLFRLIIAEEGYELLKNPQVVEAWDKRMRLTGDQGTASWMLLHEMNDITKFAPEGTAQYEQINSVLTKAGVQVIYKQTPASLNQMRSMLGDDLSLTEIETIRELAPHCGLWRVGGQLKDVVVADFGPDMLPLVDTERNRRG